MTVPRESTKLRKATKPRPRFVLTENAPEVIAILATGENYHEVARLYECQPMSVFRFAEKHAEAIAALAAEIERQVQDFPIAQKVNRIAALNEDWQGLGRVIEERAADPAHKDVPGYSTGLMVHQYKSIGGGDNAQVVDEYKVDTAVIAERRQLARAAAEELAQLPRPDVHVGDTNTFILNVQGVARKELG